MAFSGTFMWTSHRTSIAESVVSSAVPAYFASTLSRSNSSLRLGRALDLNQLGLLLLRQRRRDELQRHGLLHQRVEPLDLVRPHQRLWEKVVAHLLGRRLRHLHEVRIV